MEPDGKIRGWFVINRGTKIMALLLAAITWYAILETISYEVVIADIPLIIRPAPGTAVLNRSTDAVDVYFRGSREDVQQLKKDYVRVEIDAADLVGSAVIAIRPRDVKAPVDVRVVSIRPDTVQLHLDREGEKQVPVKVVSEDQLPNGYVVEKLTCSPATVKLKGPILQIQGVEAVKTRPVSLKGRDRTFRERTLIAPPSEIWDAVIDPEKVVVEAVIVEHAAEKLMEAVEVRALIDTGTMLNIQVVPTRINITLKGGIEALNEMDLEDISAYVDCMGLDPASRYDLPVKVNLPVGISVEKMDPSTVSVMFGVP